MQKLVYIFILMCVLSVQTYAGPIIVGPGAGEAEYSVIFVRSNLSNMLEECGSFSCHLLPAEQKVLGILKAQAGATPPPRFKTSVEMANRIFELHGRGRDIEVWINQDLLWQDAMKTVPFDVGDAAELWIHILATVTNSDQGLANSIGQKIKGALSNDIRRGSQIVGAAPAPGAPIPTVEFILWHHTASDTLIARDPRLNTLDLSASIAAAIHCTEPAGAAVSVVPRIFSPAWLPLGMANLRRLDSEPNNRLRLTLQFGVNWTCGGKTFNSHGLTLIELVTAENPPVFDPSSVYTFVEQGAFREN